MNRQDKLARVAEVHRQWRKGLIDPAGGTDAEGEYADSQNATPDQEAQLQRMLRAAGC